MRRKNPTRCKLINDKAWRQSCKICTGEHAELLHHLPFTDPIVIEDERHVLAVCPAYQHLRDKLSGYVASALDEWSNAEKLTDTLRRAPRQIIWIICTKSIRDSLSKENEEKVAETPRRSKKLRLHKQ